MKRIILGVAVLLITFGFGIGVDRLIWLRSEVSTPTVKAVPAAIVRPVADLAPVVMPVPTVPASPESRIILDYVEGTFYPDGTYSFIGATPKEFTEVASFVLDYEIKDEQKFGYIDVSTKSGEYHESNVAIFGIVNERRLIFLTGPNAKTRFEYFFDGEFLRKDLEEVSGLNKAVLKGTLIKMKDGRKVAERVVSFVIEQHGC
jgi:hypothetical protein